MFEMRCRSVATVFGTLVLIAATPAVDAGPQLLGLHWNVDILYDVDRETGATTNPRPITTSSLVGLTMATDGTLYSLSSFGGDTPNSLFTIDRDTGTAQLVGGTGLTDIFEGDLDINPTNGLLYGLQSAPVGTVRELFLINPATGGAAVLGSIDDDGDLSGMAFDAAGNLFVVDIELGRLLTVDPSTAAILDSVPLSTTLGGVVGMDFHPSTGILYLADGGTNGTDMLYTLDTVTGNLTPIGPTGLADGVAGLTFDNLLLCDGFESGDTSAWSSAVP